MHTVLLRSLVKGKSTQYSQDMDDKKDEGRILGGVCVCMCVCVVGGGGQTVQVDKIYVLFERETWPISRNEDTCSGLAH